MSISLAYDYFHGNIGKTNTGVLVCNENSNMPNIKTCISLRNKSTLSITIYTLLTLANLLVFSKTKRPYILCA